MPDHQPDSIQPKPVEKKEPVVVKKYANRRLYNTETSAYVTLDDLSAMVKSERDFIVYDAKSGDELTHSVLTQIIVEQESRMASGQTMLPIPFLRQLIRFYGDSVGKLVPSYLQVSLDTLTREQGRMRDQFTTAFTPQGALEAYHEQARKNLAMFEQAMKMFSPFAGVPGAASAPGKADAPATSPPLATTLQATAPSKTNATGLAVVGDNPGAHLSVVKPTSPPATTPSSSTAEQIDDMRAQLAATQNQLAAMQSMVDKLVKSKT